MRSLSGSSTSMPLEHIEQLVISEDEVRDALRHDDFSVLKEWQKQEMAKADQDSSGSARLMLTVHSAELEIESGHEAEGVQTLWAALADADGQKRNDVARKILERMSKLN